jgi:hypothetical protein
MLQAPAAEEIGSPSRARMEQPRSPVRRVLRSLWIPTGLVVVLTAVILHHSSVSLVETVKFGVFSLLGVAIPGTLLWRRLHGGSHSAGARFFGEDVAAGTVLGHVITVLAYILVRWLGHPLLVVGWPLITLAAFALVPALRTYWRVPSSAGRRVPLWCAWAVAALAGFVVVSNGPPFFRGHGLTWPSYKNPYVDMPYHLGLIGELKHHMPPTSPSALGEPLYYHWFAFADMAATSWITGIEPQTLLFRLFMLPVLAASLLLVVAIGWRMTDRWWPGLVAAGLTFLLCGPGLCAWAPIVGTNTFPRNGIWWVSPTQGLGAMLCATLVLLLLELLRERRSGAGPWVLLGVLLVGATGAKATVLPMLLIGMLFVIAGTLVDRRRTRVPLAATGAILAALLFAQIVVFGGSSGGAEVHPLSIFGMVGEAITGTAHPPVKVKGIAVVVSIIGWACVWGGLLGLISRPKTLRNPQVLLLAGIGSAGLAVSTILRFPGSSQLFFLWTATPYISLLAARGIMAVLPERVTRRSMAMLLTTAGAGAAFVVVIRALGGTARPAPEHLVAGVLGPFALLTVVTGGLGVALAVAGRRYSALRSQWQVIMLAFVTGLALPASLGNVKELWTGVPQRAHVTTITRGTLEAGRWLRDHSRPDDVIATNAVCTTLRANGCDYDHFAVSAYTERHVLLENWVFLSSTHDKAAAQKTSDSVVPFWDSRRVADNEAAFHNPSAETVGRLRDRYGVKWLFVDVTRDRPAESLGRFARWRYAAGDCAVYEIGT